MRCDRKMYYLSVLDEYFVTEVLGKLPEGIIKDIPQTVKLMNHLAQIVL